MQLREALVSTQNADGGWGTYAGRPSSVEVTALAVRSLSGSAGDAGAAHGLAWLKQRQAKDGSWSILDGVPRGSWATSLAVQALGAADAEAPEVRLGLEWLVQMEGRTPALKDRVMAFITGKPISTGIDLELKGWPWEPGTVSWVEPTSHALLALKTFRAQLPGRRGAARIEEAERMLLDRVCADGGWNYGNCVALDQDLRPYPDTTALALIALQHLGGEQRVQRSVIKLEQLLENTDSGLCVALAMLALSLHGKDTAALGPRLERRFQETGFLGETRALCYALLALAPEHPFRVNASV